ncbi:MAG: NapC/NirT family cytochrome c [Candidatus Hydrogenedentes bacterium]|nr:NapC/NirT family cytochrome c [Candidatus Hydrogenedentota bacterium]
MPKAKPTYLSALVSVFGRNWITLLGGIFAGIGAFLIVSFIVLGALGIADSPYIGIMAFMVLPGVFVGGLLLVPVGVLWDKWWGVEKSEALFPVLDFNNPHTRRVGILVVVITAVNLLIVGTVSYQGVHFMDSVTFCGTVCHTVMEPEHTAYLNSPHQRVACVECHIGPGAPWFVKAKLSGLRQVLAVAVKSYPTPIPAPVENLRPSRDICEQCHWPEKFVGDRVKVNTHYQEDEANTPLKNVMLLHLGGGDRTEGIHSWHISDNRQTYYTAADPKRQKIAQVRVVHKDGTEDVFRAPEGTYNPEDLAREERLMDCIDCHNRPSHIYRLPAPEVDAALESGRISTDLPFIRKVGVEALTAAEGKEGDLDRIESQVRAYYAENYPGVAQDSPALLDGAVTELKAIYSRNVFPKMNLTWGTHPNNIGHEQSPGCFRCHDDSLTDDKGRSIGQDCEACHKILAWDEENPEILQQLGL